jgi:hypothetical protein
MICGNSQTTPGEDPAGTSFRFVPPPRHGCEHAPRECFPAARYSAYVWIGSGAAGPSPYDLGIPRDIC